MDFGGGFPLPAAGAAGPSGFREALAGLLGEAGLELPPGPPSSPAATWSARRAGWSASVLHAREQATASGSRS